MRRIVNYNSTNVLYSWPHLFSLRMSLSPTQAEVLSERVQELLVVIESQQTIIEEFLDAASEDAGRTKDKTRSTDAHAMLSSFEIQSQDLQGIADDFQTTATLEFSESDGAWEYVATQQTLIVCNCVTYGLELMEMIGHPVHGGMVEWMMMGMPDLSLYLERGMTDEKRYIDTVLAMTKGEEEEI
jgi:hypothetical protein